MNARNTQAGNTTEPSAPQQNADPQQSGSQQRLSAQQWDRVIELAWRPAWSIRSRRGCLAALKDTSEVTTKY